MNTAACICGYQDRASSKRCIDSLAGFNYVIFVDGKYSMFDDHMPPLSTDGTRELVQSYSNAILMDCPNTDEPTKRNTYVQKCVELGVTHALIIDTDEWVETIDWQEFTASCEKQCNTDVSNIYCIQMQWANGYEWRPKLWYKPEDIE